MGNRLTLQATSGPGIPSPPLSPPVPTPSTPAAAPSPMQKSGSEPGKQSNNPGSFEELHKQCKELLPQLFEGGKLIISKALSSHFQVSHTLSMNAFQPSSYKFGTTYVGSHQFGPMESYPILIGDIDASANMNANIIHQFTEKIRSKFVTQIQNNKWVATQATADYRGDNFTLSGTIGNPDVFNKTGDTWTLSSNITPSAGGLHASYHHKINEQLQVAAEIETSIQMGESTATIGYQLEIPNADCTFRGQLDSNWCVGAVLEKKLTPLPFTLALSAYGNQVKSQYRFGIGLIVG